MSDNPHTKIHQPKNYSHYPIHVTLMSKWGFLFFLFFLFILYICTTHNYILILSSLFSSQILCISYIFTPPPPSSALLPISQPSFHPGQLQMLQSLLLLALSLISNHHLSSSLLRFSSTTNSLAFFSYLPISFLS